MTKREHARNRELIEAYLDDIHVRMRLMLGLIKDQYSRTLYVGPNIDRAAQHRITYREREDDGHKKPPP